MRNATKKEHDSNWYAIRDALDVCDFIDDFPEDMNEYRQSFDKMYEKLLKLQNGFEALFQKYGEVKEDYEGNE